MVERLTQKLSLRFFEKVAEIRQEVGKEIEQTHVILGKILKPSEISNQMKRVKSNLITKDNQIPILRGTRKDHKETKDKKLGPDLRPIMGAVVGPNIGQS